MENPKNHQDLTELKAKKLNSNHYKVKSSIYTGTKDVDFSKRTVQVIPNTYLFYDSDCDVLFPGCATKSFAEHGPASTTPGKIKNVYAHNLQVQIGKPVVLQETIIDGKHCQYAESKLIDTTKGNDTLIEYQEGVIDNHSIGFQYMDLSFLCADDQDWTKYLSMLINPQDAEANGYMFMVKEIKEFEFSPVSFGANSLTPYMGVKAENKDGLAMKIMERIDLLEKQLRTGKQSDESMYDYTLEVLQLKQIITELFLQGPSIKDTLINQRRSKKDTQTKSNMVTCEGCNNEFDADLYDPSDNGYVVCPSCGADVAIDDGDGDDGKSHTGKLNIKQLLNNFQIS